MRILLTLLGLVVIVAYSVLGAFLMNDWPVVAASGMPLDTTIADMKVEDQQYTTIPGLFFAALGILFALIWGATTVWRRAKLPNFAALSLWAGILALGAPAYIFTSLANLNSVGDTYVDWNSGAAFILEAPLYVTSGIAFVIAVGALTVVLAKASAGKTSRGQWHGDREIA
ncbi:hypothetical protein [Arthrobacter sp. MYb213]|uniref:hypothetical protein n=1 Tax=Arthrobacter sp. MYb213 TaxID=1848595 RepID=UPI000CFAAA95|nr:hypothetical protein [Arthrobacter sp. MYb213]PRB68784.1 hypothetical protein CQ011_13725 [Arthrobacter sp. MYb213]